MSEANWQIVFETNNEIEASIIQGYLESNGISAVLKSDESLFFASGSPLLSNYKICVNETQMKQAQELLEEKETQDNKS
jgi:hypothetical protein